MKKRVFFRAACLALATVFLFLAASCGRKKDKIKIMETDLLAAYSRRTSEAGEVTDLFRAAMADFSFDLLRQSVNVPDREPGKLLSPLSAMLCLALIANGAAGDTRRQMAEVLGLAPEQLNPALRAFAERIAGEGDVKVETANSVWFRKSPDPGMKETFLQTVADWYDAQIYPAAFDEKTADHINLWCEKYTDGMIKKIVDTISPDDMAYLINALVFDAKWEKTYSETQIREGKFTNADGTLTDATYLRSEENVWLSGEGFYGVAKPYKGGKFSFVGLLPEGNAAAADLASAITGEAWRAAWDERQTTEVVTAIPEFRCEDFTKLTDPLRALGMTDLFDPARADLGAMAETPLYLSDVFQKTYLELDRNGTKAAAVTWGVPKAMSADPEAVKRVELDRPFLYLIVENESGLPLFLGVMEQMQAK